MIKTETEMNKMYVIDVLRNFVKDLDEFLGHHKKDSCEEGFYVMIGDDYYYTEFDVEDNVRTINAVSKAALDDVKTAACEEDGKKYVNAFTDAYGTTVYSPYNADQRAILEGFVVNNLSLPTMSGATLLNNNDGSYQYYAENVSSEAYNAYKAKVDATGFTQAL